jgi:anti-anti-sigma regulatory factor
MALNSLCRENVEIIISSGDRLTIENAGVFLQLAREALEVSKSVLVEFEPDVVFDITGLQIICSACKSAAAGGKSFWYRGPQPQGLADIINACGAERHAVCKYNYDSDCIWFGGTK